jgi:PAS domain S-box-containing protein
MNDLSDHAPAQDANEQRVSDLPRLQAQQVPVLFKELFDEALIQRIQDEFAAATGVASIITHPDGTPITKPSRFTRLCSEIVRRTEKGCRNCFKSDATLGAPHAGGPVVQPCLSGGLWDAGASIIVGGQHVANWLIGQVRDETQTEDAMRAYAREIGVDETLFLEAFHEVPAMSREQFGRVAQVLHTLANQLSASAYQNLQQTRSIAQLQRTEALLKASEEKHRHLVQNLHAGVVVHASDTRVLLYNQTALQLLGLSADQILGKAAMDPAWCFVDELEHLMPLEHYPVVQVLTTRRPLIDFVVGITRPNDHGRSWVLVNAFPEFDERQQLSQVVVTFVDITERKRATDALRESEVRQRAMVANIADVIAIIDANGINRYKSPNLERWFGWRPEEVEGRPTFELVHPEDVPRIQAVFTDLLRAANATNTAQCRYRCRDGSYKWIEFTAVNLVHDPAIQGVLLNYHDITERKRAEEVLQLTHFSVEAASDHLFWITPDARIVDVNAASCRSLGYTREELLQLRVPDVDVYYNAETWPQHFAALRQCGSLTFESVQRAKDGRLFPVEVVANYIKHGSEERNCAFVRDITERKRVEAKLAESEKILRDILESTLSGFWDWNLADNTEYLSPTFKRMFGYEDHEMENSPEAWQKIIFPEDLPEVLKMFDRHVKSRGQEPFNNEIRYRHRDGSTVWVICAGRVMEWAEDGTPMRMVGCHIDITDRKRAEAALQLSLREKEALLKEVHHRVKNNLQVVTSLLRLEAGRSVEPGTKAVLREMQSRIRTMAVLHETLYRSGNFAAVDLSGYLKQLSTHLFRAHNTEPGRVRLELDLAPIPVEIDQAIPCGLIVNELVTNSLKHAFPPPRGGEVRISLRRDEKGDVQLQVSDTGAGLPANFDPGRASTLGLQLVSDLARQLRGTLGISPSGAGAGFTLTFAAGPPSSADAGKR